MNADVYNLKNEKVQSIELNDSIFKVKWNASLIHQILVAQLANRRTPIAHAKGRGEVRGGGRKPWRQKGTGRARHGSIRSPIWIGGGKAHGPSKERNYEQKVNKKMKSLAVKTVLSKKLKDNQIKIFNNFDFEPKKTKIVAQTLKFILGLNKNSKKFDLLIIPSPENKNLGRIARNLPKIKVLGSNSLNTYDLLNYHQIFIEQPAVEIITRQYQKS